VVPVGVDPRWLVEIDVLSIDKAEGRFDKKGPVILAIHSPVMVFRKDREHVPGKVYQFTISGSTSDGRPTYDVAEAHQATEADTK